MENFIVPKTKNQKHLIKGIENEVLAIAIGPAGTGKTYCACMTAAKLFITGEISTIIMTRANVPTGRTLGHFPGTIEEKLSPWLAPMISALGHGLGAQRMTEGLENHRILMQPLETIRGQSFANSLVLVDEAQNLTMEEIKALVTRVGDNSKIVLMGDPKQSDVRDGIALTDFAELCDKHGIAAPVIKFTMDDIVRSDIVAQLVKMFYEEEI